MYSPEITFVPNDVFDVTSNAFDEIAAAANGDYATKPQSHLHGNIPPATWGTLVVLGQSGAAVRESYRAALQKYVAIVQQINDIMSDISNQLAQRQQAATAHWIEVYNCCVMDLAGNPCDPFGVDPSYPVLE